MAGFCTNCGKELADGMAYCVECGTRVANKDLDTAETASNMTYEKEENEDFIVPEKPPIMKEENRNVIPVVTSQNFVSEPVIPSGKYGVIKTGGFFGMIFLFSIPIVGWIICLIMALTCKNENRKHFAKAVLIWILISAVFIVITVLIFIWFGSAILEYFNSITNSDYSQWMDTLNQLK